MGRGVRADVERRPLGAHPGGQAQRRGEAVRDGINARPADLVIADMQIGTMGGSAVALDLQLESDAGRLVPCPVLLILDRRPDVFIPVDAGSLNRR